MELGHMQQGRCDDGAAAEISELQHALAALRAQRSTPRAAWPAVANWQVHAYGRVRPAYNPSLETLHNLVAGMSGLVRSF